MWHVVHTEPNRERQVREHLATQGLTTFLAEFPAARGTRPGSVRSRRSRPVFPGYVFFQSTDPAAWGTARRLPGVRRVLMSGLQPAIVEDAFIDALRTRLAALRLRGPGFAPGQLVRIAHGPLALVDAVFDSELRSQDRVRILIRVLDRQVAVETDRNSLLAAS